MKATDAAWRAFSQRLFDQNKFAIKLGLESMRVAFSREGDPQLSAPAIVVGGTNGKGGTSAALVAILEAHGLTTGFFSSPHLIELRERFRVSGRPVSRDVALDEGRAVLERFGDPETSEPCLTFFELTTLAGAKIFQRMNVDVTVWEVGLGGRLDAVNAIEPALTVVTSIGKDHQQYLGETIDEIAGEKAALFRPNIPAVIGPQQFPEAAAVLRHAAPHAIEVDPANATEHFSDRPKTTAYNIATALTAAEIFLGDRFDPDVARRAAESSKWWGRMERLELERDGTTTTYLIDASHNPQGAEKFYEWALPQSPGAFVIGAMKEKDLRGLFGRLATVDLPYFIAEIDSPRAAAPLSIERAVGWAPAATGAASSLLRAARKATQGPIAVFGSLYLLGEVYDALGFGPEDFAVV